MGHDLIVIGGSAGSIEPLKTILRNLPLDLPAAVLIVVHIPSNSTGIFNTVTAAAGPLPVKNADDGEELVHGQVYLAPPNRHMLVLNDRLRLGHGPRENLVRPSIDPLMRSVALSYGGRAIGVILSGLMNDGASGLATLKRAGGIALVQAPVDAAAKEMPLAALETTSVDRTGSADDLASAILHYVHEPAGPTQKLSADIRMEVEIAAGRLVGSSEIRQIADPVPLTCPDCGGVLSQVKGDGPLRFRCQVGHAYNARSLQDTQESDVDEAVRVALRIIEERAELVSRMARDARSAGRSTMAEMHDERASEYRGYADVLRTAIMKSIEDEEIVADEAAQVLEAEKDLVEED